MIVAYNKYLANCENETSWDLVIVGESLWKNNTEKVPLNTQSKSKVHFTGHLSLSDLAETMAAASCFTYVPYFEGFGIPLVEAMKCGIPIISGNRTSLPEVAGDAAIYVDPFDVDDISVALKEMAESEDTTTTIVQERIEKK